MPIKRLSAAQNPSVDARVRVPPLTALRYRACFKMCYGIYYFERNTKTHA